MVGTEHAPAPDTGAPGEAADQRRRPILRRTGCALGVLVWAVLMMIPLLLFALAVRGEISVATGGAPEQRLRVWLIMDAAQRGVGISTAAAYETGGGVCVQTDVRFLLWQGRPEAQQRYCECYERGAAGEWRATSVVSGACPMNDAQPGQDGDGVG